MTNLRLYLLGPPRIELDEVVIEVKPRKALALLIYLAVTTESHQRDFLATLLWPDSDQGRARHALRNRLSELKQTLGGEWFDANRENIGLRDGFWLDVAEFQQHLAQDNENPQTLSTAQALYRDNFLSGFTLPDTPEFDEWQFFQTESLRQRLAATLETLTAKLAERGDYVTAVPHARRWLSLDPLHEPACRQLMLLYARTGQQSAALRQYDHCHLALKEELGVLPSEETIHLYNEIKSGRVGRHTRPPHNLPVQVTSFIGRVTELIEIERLLLVEAGYRLLNLVGPGGTGKTRLALATAINILTAFPDGAFFVPLAPVGEVEDIVPAIAAALRFTFYGGDDALQQLLDYLRRKRLLLVVDNFEHLQDGAGLLSAILNHAPHVTLLVTSRERLNLREEWVYDVQGLSFPVDDQTTEAFAPAANSNSPSETAEVWGSYSAIELFTQRARQVVPNFSPSAAEVNDIARICQLVEGMPLGLELAAPWTKVLSCHEIAAEIERSLDFLATTLQNLPERHRSLRVVFEQTWQRLSRAEQTVLGRLTVFRGGCTREAAQQVAGATLPVMSSLVDKSLVRRTNIGRFELHELVRQFAEMQLGRDSSAVERIRQRHQRYFIRFLEARTTGLKGHKQKQTLAEIETDMDNVRRAWRRIVTNRDAAAIDRAAECLYVYYSYSSGHYEGQLVFKQTVAALVSFPNPPPEDIQENDLRIVDQRENLVGFLLAGQAYFLASTTGGQVLPEHLIVQLLRAEPGNRRKEAIGLAFLSYAVLYQGNSTGSRSYAEAGLALATELDEPLSQWWCLIALGNPAVHSRPVVGKRYLERALSVCQKSGDPTARGYSYLNLGRVCVELGQYREAAHYFEQVFTIFEDVQNIRAVGYNYEDRGRLQTALGDYTAAIEDFQEALAYYDETRTALHTAHCRVWLGIALRLDGDWHRAEGVTVETLATFKTLNDPLHTGYCLLNLGCLAQERGELSQAEALQREALTLWQGAKLEARVADASRYLGHLMIASGQTRFAEARRYYQTALDLSLKHRMAPVLLDVLGGAAQLLVGSAGKTEWTIKLLALVEQHRASTFATRKRARGNLAELLNQLGLDEAQTTQVRGEAAELWATAQELSAALAVDDW